MFERFCRAAIYYARQLLFSLPPFDGFRACRLDIMRRALKDAIA